MLENTFAVLIQRIAGSNGRGQEELDKNIRAGTLTAEEAALIEVYANAQRVALKLAVINRKLDDQPSNYT